MKALRISVLFSVTLLLIVSLSSAQEKIDFEMADKIRDEGFSRSHVMELASYMGDVYGPRLTNSPGYDRSARWVTEKFKDFGISVEMQPFDSPGVAWENKYTSVHMHKPEYQPVIAYPISWSRSTNGKIISNVVYVNSQKIYSESDLSQYRGKLRNKIVFIMPIRKLELQFNPLAVRLSEEELEGMAELHVMREEKTVTVSTGEYEKLRQGLVKEPLSQQELYNYLEREGAAVIVTPGQDYTSHFDKGVVYVPLGDPIGENDQKPLPQLIMATEHYNRVLRVLEKGIDVEMEVEIRNNYIGDDANDYNVIAEIPGSDLRDEIVIIGGHLDGESAGTGSSDNAAGAATVMEAMRILKETGAKPRRTIRGALWGSGEIGNKGASRYVGQSYGGGASAYIAQNFGGPEPSTRLPDHEKLSIYLNMDWYGKFRGIYMQGNDLVRPIFEAWMEPFHDVGMTYLIPGNTAGTDHLDFISAGLPGFQFVQDDLEFFTTTYHTNMDVYDRLVDEDLMQASVIMASWAYFAAMRDELIPRTENQMKNNRRWHK